MSKGNYDNIPSRQAAMAKVATYLGGLMGGAASFEELTGVPEEAMTPAERERVSWATGEIQRRLYKLGGTE
jgi:hypothetical protein